MRNNVSTRRNRILETAIAFSLLLFCIVLMPLTANAWERSSPSVPPDSSLYRDIDKLVAFGFVEPPILSQRPYPRSEFARMTAEAMATLKTEEAVEPETLREFVKRQNRTRQVEIVIERLEKEFREELVDMGALEGERETYRVHPIEDVMLYARYLNSPPTTVPVNNGRGPINAQINPLGDYDLGRHAIDGGTNAIEFDGRFTAGRFFSGYVIPRFEVDMPRTSGDMSAHAYLQNGYGVFRAGNFSMKVGRDSMVWGFGEQGSLLYSTNPRPLDGIWLTNPTPARLPWVFKYLGRWRYTLYGANLGPEFSSPWAWLMGYKFSLAPAKYVEIGFGHAVQIGGEGAPAPSALDVVGEFMGFRPQGTSVGSPNISNHIFEIDLLGRIPPLRGLEIYGNMAIEDKWKSIKKTLVQGCSYLAGVYLPALNPSGSMDLRIEYVHTNPLQYRHTLFVDGFTINRKLVGADAGPDADTVHASFRHTLSPSMWYGVMFDWDLRRSNTYAELANPDGTAGGIVKTASGPSEERFRGMANISFKLKQDMEINTTVGYERVGNIFFTQGMGRNNYLAAVSLKIDLDRHFGFAAH